MATKGRPQEDSDLKLTDFLSESHILIRVPETRDKRGFLGYLVQEAVARGLLPADHEADILDSLLWVPNEGLL